jgi:hypothetical protein
MLSAHSSIYVVEETGYLPFLGLDPNKVLNRDDISRLLRRIGALNRFWTDLVSDESAFFDDLAPEPRLACVLDALYRRFCLPREPARWGDKTPLYVRYVPQIVAIFPAAQFIHIIRDGRDASLSARSKWGGARPYMDLYYLLRNWQRNVESGRQAGAALGDQQVLELRYEDLVSAAEGSHRGAEATLNAICQFLGVSFEPQMLDFWQLARQEGGGLDDHVEVQAPLHQASAGRWQREMTLFERQMSWEVIGATLEQLGYPASADPPMSRQAVWRLRLLAARFKVLDGLRSLLYRLDILSLNRNRRSSRISRVWSGQQ